MPPISHSIRYPVSERILFGASRPATTLAADKTASGPKSTVDLQAPFTHFYGGIIPGTYVITTLGMMGGMKGWKQKLWNGLTGANDCYLKRDFISKMAEPAYLAALQESFKQGGQMMEQPEKPVVSDKSIFSAPKRVQREKMALAVQEALDTFQTLGLVEQKTKWGLAVFTVTPMGKQLASIACDCSYSMLLDSALARYKVEEA